MEEQSLAQPVAPVDGAATTTSDAVVGGGGDGGGVHAAPVEVAQIDPAEFTRQAYDVAATCSEIVNAHMKEAQQQGDEQQQQQQQQEDEQVQHKNDDEKGGYEAAADPYADIDPEGIPKNISSEPAEGEDVGNVGNVGEDYSMATVADPTLAPADTANATSNACNLKPGRDFSVMRAYSMEVSGTNKPMHSRNVAHTSALSTVLPPLPKSDLLASLTDAPPPALPPAVCMYVVCVCVCM